MVRLTVQKSEHNKAKRVDSGSFEPIGLAAPSENMLE